MIMSREYKMATTANSQNLPEEIMVEIFSRLPTKSVGKCRCLSKSWNSRLSTSQFINSHLVTHKRHQENIILITPSHSLHAITTPVENNTVFSRKLELHDTWTQVWGSCNGLVLLENEAGDLYLVNPVTLQKAKIPEFDLALKENETNVRTRGFGYDSCSDDYKIVTLSSYDTYNGYGDNCDDTFVDVYSVKTGVWKRVDKFPYDHNYPSPVCGAYVNGAIHWLAATKYPPVFVIPLYDAYEEELYDVNDEEIDDIQQANSLEACYPSLIVAFDLACEIFYEVPAPCDINVMFNTLVVLGGRLCMADEYSFVWTMEEYGLVESWTWKLGPNEYEVWDATKPLCFVSEDEVVLTTYEMYLILLNVKEQMSRYLVVDGVPAYSVIDTGTFVDSLVSAGYCGDF